MTLVDRFDDWLSTRAYAITTRTQYARALARLIRGDYFELDHNLAMAARAYLTWAEDVDGGFPSDDESAEELAASLRHALDAYAEQERIRKRKRGAKRRMYEARSYPDDDVAKLIGRLEDDDTPEAAVLLILLRTGLRVHDVLTVTRSAFLEGRRTGIITITQKGGSHRHIPLEGAQAEWERLGELWDAAPKHQTVAHLVSPRGDGSPHAGGAAYKRVYRRLQSLGEGLDLTGRHHPHRARRTVAIQALRATKDLDLVRQLLGQRSIATTARYVDEERPDDVGELQKKLAQRLAERTAQVRNDDGESDDADEDS